MITPGGRANQSSMLSDLRLLNLVRIFAVPSNVNPHFKQKKSIRRSESILKSKTRMKENRVKHGLSWRTREFKNETSKVEKTTCHVNTQWTDEIHYKHCFLSPKFITTYFWCSGGGSRFVLLEIYVTLSWLGKNWDRDKNIVDMWSLRVLHYFVFNNEKIL